MLLTIERVAILRQVSLFESVPDMLLATIAQIMLERPLEQNETFITEGEIDPSLYIIVEGHVRVHSQGQTIITLGPGQSVGELAVLDPEPRSASVTAEDEALLFCLEKEAFDEIMSDRYEIAAGVIKALCHRIREQGKHISASDGG